MKTEVEEFIKSKRFAVVGVSRDPKKFGNTIYKELKSRGYEVYGVHPSAEEIAGEKCYPGLSALRGRVDAAILCTKPANVEPILQEAADAGVRNVWLQQGAESRAAVDAGKKLGINVVAGNCILMYAEPVHSFHAFHRFFVRVAGRY
jgi:predicted CoA-binding protein